MAVGIGTVSTGGMPGTSASTTTISFTSTNQPLYVLIPGWYNSLSVNTVTYGGTGLTRVAQSAVSNSGDRVEIWRLLAPAAGTANLVVTFSGTTGTGGTVMVFNTTGQDTGTPEGTAATNASAANGTTTGSLSISGAASGDLVIVAACNGAGAAMTPSNTGGTGLTEFTDVAQNGEESEGFRVSDACTAVSTSWTGSTSWAIAAIPLKVLGGAADPFPAGYRLRRFQPPNWPTLLAR